MRQDQKATVRLMSDAEALAFIAIVALMLESAVMVAG
jgi:hypothetical protein